MNPLGIKESNTSESDPFLVARLTKDQLPAGTESWQIDYLRKSLPAVFYGVFVPLERGLISFLWVPDANDWWIYHATIVCM